MITKEQWQQVRDMEEIPLFLWFDYYRENGGVVEDLGIFESHLWNILAQEPMIISKQGRPLRVNYDTAVNRLYDFYVNKFLDNEIL